MLHRGRVAIITERMDRTMKPFTAWLAMKEGESPVSVSDGDYILTGREGIAFFASSGKAQPQPVIVIPDTPENRKMLGMEER
jgi:hypothetical protein